MSNLNYRALREIIHSLKNREYEFTSFSKIKFSQDANLKNKVIIRHDIDLSLEKAVEMAEIEHELGISTVYFLFMRSPFYNLFSHKGEKLVRRLIELQHYIGLHFDYSGFSTLSPSTVTYNILEEIHFMEKLFQIKLDSVSFHRPFSLDFFEKLELGNYPHAYEYMFVKKFNYYSDSRGLWRYGNPLESEAYKNNEPLQILIHPVWWSANKLTPIESLKHWKKNVFQNFNESTYAELKAFWDSQSSYNIEEL